MHDRVPLRLPIAVLLLACGLLTAPRAGAQALDTATIRGRVIDQTGAGIPGVGIVVTNTDTALTRTTVTDQGGYYSVAGLPLTGEYRVDFSKSGFAEKALEHIGLRAGESAAFNVTMLASGGTTTITVYGTTSGVRSDSSQIGTRLDARKIEETPVLGRKLTSLPLLDSAVRPAKSTGDLFLGNSLFVVDGAGRRQTTYTLDGASADDAWGRQTVFANVPLDAVQEFTVLTNGFSAEYGRTSGAAVNIVTKSGTNTLHGDLLGMWMPGALEAKAPLAATSNADRLGQGSFAIGGPIRKDRTYYFLSGEYTSQLRDSTVTSALAPGVYTGRGRRGLFDGRVDDKIDETNTLTAQFNADVYSDTNPNDVVGGLNTPSTGRIFRRRAYAGQVSETSVLSDTM
ncbi:MAG TPA: carboxypeptidase regulatory-like domain-containing protein, partial [Vicinamibacterales bacterium]|nr:carboxypeptidase regulatory-like domain-containing protein [Vicinamibacterales bacterium]